MRLTSVLRKVSSSASKTKLNKDLKTVKSLALSVYFKTPELNHKEYEILCRGSAFLLSVDPPSPQEQDGPYGHLESNEYQRKTKMQSQHLPFTPLDPKGRELKDIGWLEYAPIEARPTVHCVCSSHVLAPYLFKDFYQEDFLTKVKQEHCTYALEVVDPNNPAGDPLGRFALNPYPIHHPEGRDIAVIHLKQEEENLKLMQRLGVQVHYMRDLEEVYQKGDEVTFDGYNVAFPQPGDEEKFMEAKKRGEPMDDSRIFFPYKETGKLLFYTQDRFFATTPTPLPEGVCGGPVLDSNDKVCGIVEGIVNKDNPNKDIAGTAAFMPNYVMAPFIEYAERFMLQHILPPGLFEKAVQAKTTNTLNSGTFKVEGSMGSLASFEEEFDRAVENLKKNYSKEEIDAIVKTVERERKEVAEIMDRDGGDMHDILQQVRGRTMQIRELIHEEYRKGNKNPKFSDFGGSGASGSSNNANDDDDGVMEAEVIDKTK